MNIRSRNSAAKKASRIYSSTSRSSSASSFANNEEVYNCQECGEPYTVGAEERNLLAQKALDNGWERCVMPKRCKPCRKLKRMSGGQVNPRAKDFGSTEPQMNKSIPIAEATEPWKGC